MPERRHSIAEGTVSPDNEFNQHVGRGGRYRTAGFTSFNRFFGDLSQVWLVDSGSLGGWAWSLSAIR